MSGILGTPQYMAPEQFVSRADVRTDVWGLGVTLYELLTLRPAFDGSTYPDIREKILAGDPPAPRKRVRSIPADLAAICRQAMQKEPARRYPTAQAFADDLRRWLRREPVSVRRPVWRRLWLWARRNTGWAALIFVTLFGLAGIVGLMLQTAQARTDAARAMADAADRRARDQERQTLLLRLQQARMVAHTNGWFKNDVERLAQQIADLHKGEYDEALRDQLVAAFSGMDAQRMKVFRFDSSSVAFSPDGKRLLMGGSLRRKDNRPNEPARVWDIGSPNEPRLSEKRGAGAVAFRRDDALHLIPDADDFYLLRLRNLDKQEEVRRFRITYKRMVPRDWYAGHFLVTALSPDGTLAAAAARPPNDLGSFVVWEVQSGKELHRENEQYTRPTINYTCLAFSPDSSLLAGGDSWGQITVWSVKLDKLEPVELVAELPAGPLPVLGLALVRDRRLRPRGEAAKLPWLLAAGDAGGAVTIWDLDTKQLQTRCLGSAHEVNASAHEVHAVAFRPDGALLASAGRTYTKLWDVATGQPLLDLKERNWMTGVAFSPDGKRLAVGSVSAFGSPGGINVWELDYGRGIQTLHGLAGRVQKVVYSPNSDYLAALSDDWQAVIWDLSRGELLHRLAVTPGFSADNCGLAFSPDGKRFAVAAGTTARVWDLSTGKEQTWSLRPGLNDLLAFDPSGKKLILVRVETQSGQLPPRNSVDWQKHPQVCRVYNLLEPEPEKEIREIPELPYRCFTEAIAPDGSYFLITGVVDEAEPDRWIMRAIETETGKPLWNPPPQKLHDAPRQFLDPTGRTMTLKTQPGERIWAVVLLEMPSGKLLETLDSNYDFSPGPGAQYLIRKDSAWSLYRRSDRKPLAALNLTGPPSTSPLFDAAGRRVAWGRSDGTITVCDIEAVQCRLAAFDLGW